MKFEDVIKEAERTILLPSTPVAEECEYAQPIEPIEAPLPSWLTRTLIKAKSLSHRYLPTPFFVLCKYSYKAIRKIIRIILKKTEVN